MIETSGLTKQFDDILAVDHISAKIRDGSVFGLIGTNGAGKSTFLRMVSGILKPDEGAVLIDGENVYENPAVKSRFFYISDDQYFFANGTPLELMKFYKSIYPAFDEPRFFHLLQSFDLDKKRKISTFSKGMKKQLSIIYGICAGTDYIFCDETFDGLDPVMRQAVKSLFASDMAERNLTPIIASHNLRELEDICDHVGLLHKGGILLSKDLDDMKLNIHKIQCVLKPGIKVEDLTELDILKTEYRGSLATITVRGSRENVERQMAACEPLFFELIPLSLEEIFISETEVAGYDIKKLIFKLMKEDLKRRLWAIGFSVLALFFAMPMAAAMGIGEIGNQYKQWLISGTGYENMVPEALRQTKILRLAGEILGFENYALFMVVGAAAMILGLTGFLYLHSKKQIDFYNSLPVKREMLFTVKFLDGFLIILAAYLINMFAAFGIFCGNGIAAGDLFKMMFASFAVNMIGFLLIYVVMVIAVLLTGNLFISILGAGVLYGYLPAVSLLIEGLKSLFFVTRGREGDVYWLAKYGSPIGYFTKLAGAGLDAFHSDQFYDDIDYGFSRIQMELQSTADSGAELLKLCGLGIFAAVILTGIALVLYRIRPSEAAGKAMSFKKTQAPIKILLLIPMTVTTTVFLWSIYYSGVWAAVGFVLGLVLTSCLIEIIYHFDFTKLFANPVQTVIGGAIAILVVGAFWMDVFGYDSYIPDEKDFVSASIDLNLDNEPDCGLPYRSGDSYNWRYMNSSDYADANMKLTDYAVVRAFAEKAVENAKQQRNQQIKGDGSYSYRDDGGYMIYVKAGYRQKNGKTVYRSYRITRSVLGSTLDEIYATKEYKDGTYPVMSYQPENITGIYWLSDRGILEVSADDTLRAEILAAYQEELAGLTINERAVEVPVAALRFLTKAENEYLGAISSQRGYTSQGFQMEDMQIVNFVPVYPSFTKTIALLKQAGTDVTAKLSADDVTQVKILYPTEYESTAAGENAVTGEDVPISEKSGGVTAETELKAVSYGGQKMLTIVNDGSEENRRKIEEILSASAPEIMLDRNRLCTYEMGIEIDVSIKPDSAFSFGNGTVDERVYRIMGDTVPECIEKALNYSKISTKYVRKGIGVMKND